MSKILKLYTIALFCFIFSCNKEKAKNSFDVKGDNVQSPNGMVVSAHRSASEVGIDILKKGGNAYDAAIAVQFALAVVYPQAGNIGGGGFAIVRTKDGTVDALDFREKAPLLAHKDMYLDSAGQVITGLSTLGHKAAGVPGTVDGMVQLHQKYGSMPWEELVKPSIKLAEEGFVLKQEQADRFNRFQEEFITQNSNKIPLVKDTPWKGGDQVNIPDLAKTLAKIADKGRDGFYKGSVAQAIIAEMERGGGLITQKDLDQYSAKWRLPLIEFYKGHKIITMPPPSSGGVALLQLLQGAEMLNISQWKSNSAGNKHAITELARRVYADRATYLGDDDFVDVPVEMLIDTSYTYDRFSSIDLTKKTPSDSVKEGKVTHIESTETTHFTIVDKDRNAVAITTTVNGLYGCKVMVDGAGFFLNNEMDDFSSKPGVPNQFGLVGSVANAIAPEKRMLSSMTPTIIEKDGKLMMTTGTRGGSTIITSVFQSIINVIDYQMPLDKAIEEPRIHHQWQPDVVYLEKLHYDSQLAEGLRQLGHEIDTKSVLGYIRSIKVLENGDLHGVSDYARNQGVAIGY